MPTPLRLTLIGGPTVLLSDDQHADNLDHAGRAYLATAAQVLTTQIGAARLGQGAVALAPL
jgi:hypothetical protein